VGFVAGGIVIDCIMSVFYQGLLEFAAKMEFVFRQTLPLCQGILTRRMRHDAGSIFNGFIETTSSEARERFVHAQELQKSISSVRHTFRLGGGKAVCRYIRSVRIDFSGGRESYEQKWQDSCPR
jgi:hypothetical protein